MMMNTIVNAVEETLGKKTVSESSAIPRAEGTKMKAVTWQGKKHMAVIDVPKPMITHSEDVIVKITSCTICSGSDGHVYCGEIPGMEKGFTIGHEGMGIIEEIGSDVQKFKKGDRVVISFCIACGKCEQCKKEHYSACETTNHSKLAEQCYGHAPAALCRYGTLVSEVPGSQAEYVRVPFADTNCFLVPDDIPDEKALYLSDVVSTSLCGLDAGEMKEGDTVCVWGLGPIGLCTCMWAKAKGAKRVVGIDMVPERLALAQKKLGVEVVDRGDKAPSEMSKLLLEMEPKGFDVCIEAVGFRFPTTMVHKVARALYLETDSSNTIDECITCVKPYGNVFLLGDYVGYTNVFPIGKIMFKACKFSSRQANVQKYIPEAMEAIRRGTIDPSLIITHKITLDQIPEYYEKLDQKKDGCIKVFVKVAQEPRWEGISL